MVEEKLWITNRFGEKLEALVRKPSGESKFPAVLFVSGFGMDLHEYNNSNDEISKRLVEKGFFTMQFSFAGRGKSEGRYQEMTIHRQAQQVIDMLHWLGKRSDVNSKRIGIFAQSFGVATTIVANPRQVKSMVFNSGAYYPYSSMQKVFREEYASYNPHGLSSRKSPSTGVVSIVGPQFWKTLSYFDQNQKKQCLLVKTPVFMVHGDKDNKITVDKAKQAFDYLASKQKKLKIFQGGDHGITDVPRAMREEFLRDVVDWFRKTL